MRDSIPVWFELATAKERSTFRQRGCIPLRFKILKCEVCLGSFFPSSSQQKTCCKECKSEYRSHKDSEIKKRCYQKKKEAYKERMKENYISNYVSIREKQRQYRLKNPDLNREYHRKIRSVPSLRLKQNIECLITKNIRRQNGSLCATRSFELVGLGAEEFMDYLLNHDSSKKEFTRSNYGEAWEVDHIQPLASFDLVDPDSQRRAFHYTNCQPLTPSENRRKGSIFAGQKHMHV